MIWTQHDGKLFYYAREVTTHQAKAMSKKMPDKIIVRINQDGEELTKYFQGERVKAGDIEDRKIYGGRI